TLPGAAHPIHTGPGRSKGEPHEFALAEGSSRFLGGFRRYLCWLSYSRRCLGRPRAARRGIGRTKGQERKGQGNRRDFASRRPDARTRLAESNSPDLRGALAPPRFQGRFQSFSTGERRGYYLALRRGLSREAGGKLSIPALPQG